MCCEHFHSHDTSACAAQVAIIGGGVAALLCCACLGYWAKSCWSARRKRANRPDMSIISQTRGAPTSPRQAAAATHHSVDTDFHGTELQEVTADLYPGPVGQHNAPPQPASTSEEGTMRAALAASLEDLRSGSREAEEQELAHAIALSLASEAQIVEPGFNVEQPVVAMPVHAQEAIVSPLAAEPLATLPSTIPHMVMGVAVPQPQSLPPPALSMSPPPPSRRFCTSCGTPILAGARFCAGCGTRIQIEATDFQRGLDAAGSSSTSVADTSSSAAVAVPSPRLHGDFASSSSDSGRLMVVYVKTHTARTIMLELDPMNTIADLMSVIKEREGLDASEQRLLFGGRQLETNTSRTLSECGVQKESVIHLLPVVQDL